jgi:protein-S-isoprenylcysteine O-methyltransferase Ste14
MNLDLQTSLGLFPSPAAGWAFWIITVVWLLGEFIGGSLIPDRKRGGGSPGGMNRALNVFTVIADIAVYIIALNLAANKIAMLPGWTSYIGISLMILGIVVRQWAIAVLGRYFSGATGVLQDHKVVEAGPYRIVRHPSFTGVLLILAGIGLALQSWGAALTNMAIFGLVYGYRILAEEKALRSKLGDDYARYMKRTKRLIPFII